MRIKPPRAQEQQQTAASDLWQTGKGEAAVCSPHAVGLQSDEKEEKQADGAVMVEPADVAWQLSFFKTPPWMRCRVRHTAAAETVHVLAPSTTTLALELVGCFARNDGTLQARQRSGRPISFHPCPGPAHVQIHFPARQTSWSCSSSLRCFQILGDKNTKRPCRWVGALLMLSAD